MIHKKEQPMTTQEQNQLWDELIDTREELARIKHVSQEVLDGLSMIAELPRPILTA